MVADTGNPELQVEAASQPPRTAWMVFQILAWFAVVGYILTPIILFAYGRTGSEIIAHYVKRDIVDLVSFLSFLACLAAILRKPWAAHLVRTTALWSLALCASVIPGVLRGIASPLFPNSEFFLFNRGFSFWYSILYLVAVGTIVVEVVVAGKVDAARTDKKNQTTLSSRLARAEKFFAAGVATVFVVIGIRSLGRYLLANDYHLVEIATTYILLCATIICMISQCFTRRYFTAISAISMSMVALFLPIIARFLSASQSLATGIMTASCFPPYSLPEWLPMLILAGLAFFSKKLHKTLRLAAVAIPLSLMLIAQFSPVSLRGSFTVEYTSSSEKPQDWPDWLTPPDEAADICYSTDLAFNGKSLHFKVQDPYPADKTLQFIAHRLAGAGFRKLDDHIFPNEHISLSNVQPSYLSDETDHNVHYNPSSHTQGWSEPTVCQRTPFICVKNWQAQWLNEADELVWVRLHYRATEPGVEDLNTLYAMIDLQPPVGWHRKTIDDYKKAHPQDQLHNTE
ncbi:MAG: hypothetical protein E4H40_03125 [Candidatus Brocadiia bacterium]|nr:MAG: hypothetical protein E4H40_03125 [Candidatus Brocadiia bacterium]